MESGPKAEKSSPNESTSTNAGWTPNQKVSTPRTSRSGRRTEEPEWSLPDFDNPPEPPENELTALKISRDNVLSTYADVDTFQNFAAAVMCQTFTEKERLVECNVAGWGKRPKLDTDPEQTRINAIYRLTYHMFRTPGAEQGDARRKITLSIDGKNRSYRRVQREQLKKKATFQT